MKECQKAQKHLPAFLSGELGPKHKRRIETHLKQCPACQKELKEFQKVFENAESLSIQIETAVDSVDWDRFSESIAAAVKVGAEKSPGTYQRRRSRGIFFQPWFRPVAAALLAGVMLGVILTMLVLQPVGEERAGQRTYTAPADFLERAEIEMARRETIDYLDKSQYLLLEFIQSTPESSSQIWQDDLSAHNVRSLLSKKKYIDPQLGKFKMIKAKAICDQVELLFFELIRIRENMTEEELKEIQDYIQEKQLLLRINLVKKELEKSTI